MEKQTKSVLHMVNEEKMLMQLSSDLSEGQTVLMKTSTGEFLMPARLYFKFLNRKNLVKGLTRLRCLEWEDDNQFMVSYWEEARFVSLTTPYDEVPEEIFPILLAKGKIVGSEVHVDVRSFKRAIEIIKLFYKHLGPKFFYITHIATYNRCVSSSGEAVPEILAMGPDKLFSNDNLQVETLLDNDDFQRIAENPEDLSLLKSRLDEIINQPLPVIQKMPVTGTKYGLSTLEARLMIQMLLAQEYWNGNINCTIKEIWNKIAEFADEESFREEGAIDDQQETLSQNTRQ